jgi:uncharacterized membrane protein YphA (DoxX/SURF4 family)
MRRLLGRITLPRDAAFELLRVYLGLGLIVKGVSFAADPDMLAQMTTDGWLDPWTAFVQHYVVMAHTAGGLMLVAGFCTRVAAFANLPVLLGAVLFVHKEDGLFSHAQGLEFSVFVLFVLSLLAWHGGGSWSADRHVWKPATMPAGVEPAQAVESLGLAAVPVPVSEKIAV